jgi:hypothetical protein
VLHPDETVFPQQIIFSSESFKVNPEVRSIKDFKMKFLKSQNCLSIKYRLFYRVLESRNNEISFPNSSFTYYYRISSFFVDEFRYSLTIFLNFLIRGSSSRTDHLHLNLHNCVQLDSDLLLFD